MTVSIWCSPHAWPRCSLAVGLLEKASSHQPSGILSDCAGPWTVAGHTALLFPPGKCLPPVRRIEGRRAQIIEHDCQLVHQKWFKWLVFGDGFFHGPALVVELVAKARPAAVLLASKLAFHPALIRDKEALPPFEIQINASITILEMRVRVEYAMGQEIQCHSIGERRSKRLYNVKRK